MTNADVCIGASCPVCFGQYGHAPDCEVLRRHENIPRRFRVRISDGNHPNGTKSEYRYGCFFPMTQLVVGDMGGRGTGEPKDVEWIDD